MSELKEYFKGYLPKNSFIMKSLTSALGCEFCHSEVSHPNLDLSAGKLNSKLILIIDHLDDSSSENELLSKMLNAIGLKIEDVLLLSVHQCQPFFLEQLSKLQPQVILTFGLVAAKTVLSSDLEIAELRRQKNSFQKSVVIPTHHPSQLIQNSEFKKESWEDLKKVASLLQLELPQKGRA